MKIKRIKLLHLIVLSCLLSQPNDLSQEWMLNSNFPFADELENIVSSEISELSNILGVVIIQDGKIISENYYNGSNQNDVFHVWSVTKSFISTLIGQSIDLGLLEDPSRSASNFFPDYGIDYTDSYTLHNLLSMSSGYQDGFFYPYWYYQDTETLLSMSHDSPGSFLYNNSACNLNSHALYYGTNMTPLEFANIHLFPYLGIEDPIWYSEYLDINDGSASLHLNLRDMVKLGQLFLQDGYSDTNQVISSTWIEQATLPQVATGSNGWSDLPNYGYLWWLPELEGSFLAFGFGGQYIAVIPQYNLVIGTHSTDWGPGSLSAHQIDLRNAIFNEVVPLLSKPRVIINEILVLNENSYSDEYAEFDSYIELFNYGSDTVDVGGYIIDNDEYGNENYFQIQTGNDSTIIAPGQFLLFWLDGDLSQGVLHGQSLLDTGGGELSLYSSSNISVDQVNYPITAPDLAYARIENGSEWAYMDPTPNGSNLIELKNLDDDLQPELFELSQNYPNPFNPETKIKYNLMVDAKVSLKIYDVKGRAIKSLVNSGQSRGSYVIKWDATNYYGEEVSGGVYLYEIKIGLNKQVKKMILLK